MNETSVSTVHAVKAGSVWDLVIRRVDERQYVREEHHVELRNLNMPSEVSSFDFDFTTREFTITRSVFYLFHYTTTVTGGYASQMMYLVAKALTSTVRAMRRLEHDMTQQWRLR